MTVATTEDELAVGGDHPNNPNRNLILEALDELGPASAQEIAQKIGRETGNVSTRLRQLEQQSPPRVRRTGRQVAGTAGQRGGPQIEWDLYRDGDDATGPETPIAAPQSSAEVLDERVRHLAERVESLMAELERKEYELAEARAESDRLREGQTALPADAGEELDRLRGLVAEIEAERDRLLAEREPDVEARAQSMKMRERYFEALLARVTAGEADEDVHDRLERLIGGAADE